MINLQTIMALIGRDIQVAKTYLTEGKLVAIPTETVYGLAANALNKEAVLDIFSAKKRPSFDPLIIHSTKDKIFRWVTAVPEKARQLADTFWPGSLTLVLPKSEEVPFEVTSGLDTVGIRVPKHDLTQDLLAQLDFPLAAPSANPFGYISPTTAQHVNDQLGEEVDYILDGGACDIGIESTIVGFESGEPVIYRLGGLTVEAIESVVGRVNIRVNQASDPRAPGMLKAHYAPGKPLILADDLSMVKDDPDAACLLFGVSPDIPADRCFNMSDRGDYYEAAARLYALLRELDHSPYKKIYARLLPEEGLGLAINDRLRRAAAQE